MPNIMNYAVTTSANHQVGIEVLFTNDDIYHEYCTVTIIPYLRNIKYTEERYQHYWNVHFAVDSKYVYSHLNRVLPDAHAGQVNNGKLYMRKNVWYQWGEPYNIDLPNDGKQHNVGINMYCLNTTPRYCPGQDVYLYYTFHTTQYQIKPTDPSNVEVVFNENTREIKYSWKAVDPERVQYISVMHKLYAGTEEWGEQSFRFEAERTEFVETLPENITSVKFTIYNISPTGAGSQSFSYITDVRTDCKVWIKLPDDSWKKATPWVKLPDGSWKKATKVYTKVDGVWKRTIM